MKLHPNTYKEQSFVQAQEHVGVLHQIPLLKAEHHGICKEPARTSWSHGHEVCLLRRIFLG